MRLVRAGISVLIVVTLSACAAVPPSLPVETAGPGGSATPTIGEQPAPTGAQSSPDPDTASDPNVPPPPLPQPELTTPDEVVQALTEPEFASPEQVVMSMLDQLGIGVYNVDGSAINAGTESTDTDFILSEPEVRGLVNMLVAGDVTASDTQEDWLSFQDFHAALAGLGYTDTADELAQAYSDAYAQNPDAPISKFLGAQAFIYVDSSMPPLAVWLMFLDGFVTPHGTPALASAGGFPLTAVGPGPGWGLAGQILGANKTKTTAAQNSEISQLMALFRSGTSLSINESAFETHEGHGGTGQPVDFTATVSVIGGGVSPVTGKPMLTSSASPQGLPISWKPDRSLTEHGGFTAVTSILDASGNATANFVPKVEEAKGKGVKLREIGLLTATVSADAFVHQIDPSLPTLGKLTPADVPGSVKLDIFWHVKEAMHIELRHDYVIISTLSTVGGRTGLDSSGLETFVGDLALNNEGLWFGVIEAHAEGEASQERDPTHFKCEVKWDTHQSVAIGGRPLPKSDKGDFAFQFFPVTNPEGTFDQVPCLPPMPRYGGVRYLPYNDRLITHPSEPPFGLMIFLPPKPAGGTNDYPANTDFASTNWHVFIQFLEPEP